MSVSAIVLKARSLDDDREKLRRPSATKVHSAGDGDSAVRCDKRNTMGELGRYSGWWSAGGSMDRRWFGMGRVVFCSSLPEPRWLAWLVWLVWLVWLACTV